MLYLVWNLLKLVATLALLALGYAIYIVFVIPYRNRRRYAQYTNSKVKVDYGEDIDRSDELSFEHSEERGALISRKNGSKDKEVVKYDIKMMHVGKDYIESLPGYKYMLFDIRNINLYLFETLIQDKIDRYECDTSIGLIPSGSFVNKSSSSHVMKRRTRVIKHCGIAFMKNKMSMVVQIIQDHLNIEKEDKENAEENLDHKIGLIVLKIFASIFFGEGFEDKISKCKSRDTPKPNEGKNLKTQVNDVVEETKSTNFIDFYLENTKKCMNAFTASIRPGPVDELEEIRSIVFQLLKYKEPDGKSTYQQILKMGKFNEETITDDMLACFHISVITILPSVLNAIKELRNLPESLLKLKSEIKEAFSVHEKSQKEEEKNQTESKNEDISISSLLQNKSDKDPSGFVNLIQSVNYLRCVVDETLRLHCPADGSLLYMANRDILLPDPHTSKVHKGLRSESVPIPKGSLLRINFSSIHFDVLEWHEPEKFIPERFDPEHEYFLRPGTKQNRNVKAYLPYSTGDRNCPGKSISNLMLKTIIACLVDSL